MFNAECFVKLLCNKSNDVFFIAKGRMNSELREKFILPEGASQARVAFTRRSSLPYSQGSTHSTDQHI